LTPDGSFNKMAELLSNQMSSSIKVVRFNGKSKADGLKDRSEFGSTCLLWAMKKAEAYVETLNLTKSMIQPLGSRIDKKLIDPESFKQAWYNACLHNRWDLGVPPAIWVFTDRIEIFSNGNIRKDMSLDEFYRGVSRPVNQELSNIFTKLELSEQGGLGNTTIIKFYGKEVFDIEDYHVIVSLPFDKEVMATLPIINNKMTLEEKIIELIRTNNQITREEMMGVLLVSKSTLERILRNSTRIIRKGSSKNGLWYVE
jgi:predicted HTH transcriptional regulator